MELLVADRMKLKRTTILLPELRFFAYHGAKSQERLTGAFFYVTAEIDTDSTRALSSDKLNDTVSYGALYRCIKKEMAIPSNLLEHVAGRIVERIFSEFPLVKCIRLRLMKENPPMGADCRQAGIEIEAER